MILWKNTFITRIIMLIINLVLVLFISIIIYNTTGRICDNNMARDFIEKIKYVPTIPWKVPVYSSILLILLFFSVILREKFLENNKVMVYALCVLDILCCVGIMYF